MQLNLFLAKCPLHEQSGHWNRWKKILNLLPAHRIAIQLLRFFFTPKLFEFLGVFPLSLSEARLKCLAAKTAAGRVQMSNAHNPQHWSQLDMDEQIRFWQGG
ncbi:Uncharacterised protein (plasmid) [Klebsiella quasipneumoniae]|nr:Uncharacterised protein [Klebsiella quasipneumoniae]